MKPTLAILAAVAFTAATAPRQQAPQATFRSSVELVRVPVVVTDGSEAVRGLTASDFELLDSTVPQKLDVRPLDAQPLDVTLVLDVSGSIEGKALDQLRADVQAIAESLQPSDRVRLLTFATTTTDLSGFQSGGAPLAMERIASGGLSSLYDALAAAMIVDPEIDRRQLVFALSDGMDNTSFLDARRIATLASTTPVTLYLALVDPSQPIRRLDNGTNPLSTEQSTVDYGAVGNGVVYGIVRRSAGPFAGPPDIGALKSAVARTGGALYEKVHDSLPDRFMHALEDYRSGYLLSYSPRGVPASGWHDIVVRTKNSRYKVRARAGYGS